MKIKEITEAFNPLTGEEIIGFDPYKLYNLEDSDSEEVPQVKEAKHLAEIIQANCSIMLDAYKSTGKVLYRGVNTNTDSFITGIRPDRKSLQMSTEFHTLLHDAFLAVGLKATRANSIFCTAQPKIATNWGNNIFVIFVKDGWSGTVFETIKNDYTFYNVQALARWYYHGMSSEKGNIQALLDGINKLKPLSFDSSAVLSNVLKSEYADVLITGDSYIGLRVGSTLLKDTMALLDNNIKIKKKPKPMW